MSNKKRSNVAARKNTTRPTSRKAQQPRQTPMASSTKWMLILGVGFMALRLIFPDIMVILGSSLKGLTIVAGIAIALAIASYIFEQSVPEFIGSLFGKIVNSVSGKAKNGRKRYMLYEDEDEFVYDEDDDDYDGEDVEYEEDEEEEPVVQRPRRRVRLARVEAEEEQVTQVTPSISTPPKPEIDVPEGYEWKLEDGKWAIRPMTPPDILVPDGFELKLEDGKWKLVAKA